MSPCPFSELQSPGKYLRCSGQVKQALSMPYPTCPGPPLNSPPVPTCLPENSAASGAFAEPSTGATQRARK